MEPKDVMLGEIEMQGGMGFEVVRCFGVFRVLRLKGFVWLGLLFYWGMAPAGSSRRSVRSCRHSRATLFVVLGLRHSDCLNLDVVGCLDPRRLPDRVSCHSRVSAARGPERRDVVPGSLLRLCVT